MRAIHVTELSGPDGLTLVELPEPGPEAVAAPGSGVLVQVAAVGLAFPDVLLSRGLYQVKPELPFVPGLEVAGTVLAAAPDAPVRAGDRVAGFLGSGALAERVVVPQAQTFELPDELDFVAGAGLVLNYHTAYFSLVTRGRLARGETVLVQGAAGGVGSAGLQIARGLGARTIAVVSSAEKEALAREAGADEVVRSDGPWLEQVRALGGVDVVLDPVGGDRFLDSVRSLNMGGRLLVVGFTGGSIPEIRVNRLLLKNVELVGAAWGAWIEADPVAGREIGHAVNELVRAGAVRPLVTEVIGIEQTADALRALEDRRVAGKVVVDLRREPG